MRPVDGSIVFADQKDRIAELEAQLAECQRRVQRQTDKVTDYSKTIIEVRARVDELELQLSEANENCDFVDRAFDLRGEKIKRLELKIRCLEWLLYLLDLARNNVAAITAILAAGIICLFGLWK